MGFWSNCWENWYTTAWVTLSRSFENKRKFEILKEQFLTFAKKRFNCARKTKRWKVHEDSYISASLISLPII